MSAAIATMRALDWDPVCPATWYTHQNGQRVQIKFNHEPGVSILQARHVAQRILERQAWDKASLQCNATGMSGGIPDLQAISKARSRPSKLGLHALAAMVDNIASGSMWSGHRLYQVYQNYIASHDNVHDNLFEDAVLGRTKKHIAQGTAQQQFINQLCQCPPCGKPNETFHHRYFEYPHNHHLGKLHDNDDDNEDDPDDHDNINSVIQQTDYLARKVDNYEGNPCMYYRGIIPHSIISDPVGWIDEYECSPNMSQHFISLMHSSKAVGTDGSGWSEKWSRYAIVAAGAFVSNAEITTYATLHTKVPGLQTAPRAEAYALLQLLLIHRTDIHIQYSIDASYVVRAACTRSEVYTKGAHGDLWHRIYGLLDKLGNNITITKVKSHVKSDEEWRLHDMTFEKVLLNCGADRVAGAAANKFANAARHPEQWARGNNTLQSATAILTRAATVNITTTMASH